MSDEGGGAGEVGAPQAFLLQMAGEIPGVVWSTDFDLRFTSSWGAGLGDLSLRPDQVVGMTLFEYFGTDDPEFQVIAAHRRALEGETVAWEQDWQGKTYQTRVAPLRDHEGRIAGCTGIAQDVTHLKRAENALREKEERYGSLVDQSLQGVVVVQGFRIVFANTAFARICGYTVEELLALTLDQVRAMVHPEDQALVWERLQARLEGKTVPPHYEYRGVCKDGTVRWLEIFAQAIPYQGKPAVQGAIVDITERKRAEEALRQSERRARALLNAPADAMFLIDTSGRVVEANETWAHAMKRPARELVGTCVFDQFPPDVAILKREYIAEVARTGKPAHFEDEYEGRIIESTVYPIFDQARKVIQIAVSARDITDRVRAEEALKRAHNELEQRVQARTAALQAANRQLRLEIAERERAERQLRLLSSAVAQSKEGVAVADLDGRLLFVNESFAALHGYPPEELIGKHLSVLHLPEQMPAVEASVQRILETGEFHGEIWHARRDGTAFPAMMHNSLLRDEAGQPTGVIGTMRDVTEQKRAEEALRESEKRRVGAEKLAATGRLAARVAHEINNPLAGIANCFRLVKDAVPQDHPHYKFVGIIEKEIDRIGRIVRQMFQVHRPDQETVRDVRVAETIGEVVAILEPNCRERRVRVETHADPAEMTIKIPEGSLRQILYNLLANAIEASPPNGVVRVAASAAEADDTVRITVADQGGGIPQAVQDHLFEPFFTTKESDTSGGLGLGLGLSISKGIVDSLRGSLDFQTEPGGGTTFRVVLPAATH